MKKLRSAAFYTFSKEALNKNAIREISEGYRRWHPSLPEADGGVGFMGSISVTQLSHFEIINGAIRIERKIPPRSLVNEIVNQKVSALRKNGRTVSREEKSIIRTEESRKLIPKTLPSYIDVYFWIITPDSKLSSDAFIMFDRSQGHDIESSLALIYQSNLMTKSCRAMIPAIFYDNLIEKIENGQTKFGIFSIGDIIEVSSEDRGIYEISKSALQTIGPKESISSIPLITDYVSFNLKKDGLIKSLSFSKSKLGKSDQVEVLSDIIIRLSEYEGEGNALK